MTASATGITSALTHSGTPSGRKHAVVPVRDDEGVARVGEHGRDGRGDREAEELRDRLRTAFAEQRGGGQRQVRSLPGRRNRAEEREPQRGVLDEQVGARQAEAGERAANQVDERKDGGDGQRGP